MTDYNRLINKALKMAFKKADSLTTQATFHLKQGQSFDFGSAEAKAESTTNRVVKVLVVKTSRGLVTVRKQILVERIADLDIYDKATLENEDWKIGPTIVDDGHMQIIEVYHG